MDDKAVWKCKDKHLLPIKFKWQTTSKIIIQPATVYKKVPSFFNKHPISKNLICHPLPHLHPSFPYSPSSPFLFFIEIVFRPSEFLGFCPSMFLFVQLWLFNKVIVPGYKTTTGTLPQYVVWCTICAVLPFWFDWCTAVDKREYWAIIRVIFVNSA